MRRALVPLVLLLGIAAVSTASVMVRFAQEGAPSLVIAAGRLALATVVLAPFAIIRHRAELRSLSRRDLSLGLVSGVLLALHFATWIVSLEHTSVVSSVVLVTTTPLWVALLAPVFLRERITRKTWLGIAVAMIGGVVIGVSDLGSWGGGSIDLPGDRAVLGDFLALSGAWMMAGYLLVGRNLRSKLHLIPYIFLVYGMAAVVLVVTTILAGYNPFAIAPASWLWILLLALVPQLLGHSSFNWALRYLPAAFVAIVLLGEPVGSAILAYVVLGELPGPLTLLGAVLVLAGIAIASRSAGREALETPTMENEGNP
jgi:drug/metabolite transporter (DMT)-like permease